MKIAEIMNRQVRCCRPTDTLDAAAAIMWDHDCGCVPVVDAEERVVGMITDRDLCMAAYTRGVTLGTVQVQDVMSRTVYTCRAEDSVGHAEQMMRINQVHRLPVVDAGEHLVGILSLNDVAQEARLEAAAHKRGVTFGEVGETLAAVCRPRHASLIAAAS
jgi:CBS domain-containing protein